jgi:hypothetical protein
MNFLWAMHGMNNIKVFLKMCVYVITFCEDY